MTETKQTSTIDWHLVFFFLIAYLIAWPVAFIFGVDDEIIRSAYSPVAAALIIYLPKFAFTISGVILFVYTRQVKEMLRRLTHWRVSWGWYVLVYVGPALLYLISAVISTLGGETPLVPKIEFPAVFWMLTLGAQTGILAYFFFRGGLGEEIGLRGFALMRLQSRHSPLKASLILGFWWGLWHLPAWIGRSVLEVVIVWLGVMAFSFLFTWVYNHTLSLPIVMLLHAALNSFDDVLENIFPSLVEMDWELPYVAGILIVGIVLAITLKRNSTNELSLIKQGVE